MNALIRWLKSWSRTSRKRARQHDAIYLWPTIWNLRNLSPEQFLIATASYTATDPNWRRHEHEWRTTEVDPAVWLARRVFSAAPRHRGGVEA